MTEMPRNFYKDMHLAAVISEAVSHKLNNSLSGILGYIQFSMEKMNKDSLSREEIEKIISYLQFAMDESLISRDLMQELRWFSKQYLHYEKNVKTEHNTIIKNLKAFWEMISDSEVFQKISIVWDKSKKHETRVDVSRESLFCFFYALILSIIKLSGNEEDVKLNVIHGGKDSIFKEIIFDFSLEREFTEVEVSDSFVLSLALIKSLYGRMDFSKDGSSVRLIIGLPLKVEKI